MSHCKLTLQITESPDLDEEHRTELRSEADRIHSEMDELKRRARQLVEELELVGAMNVTMFAKASATLLPLPPRPWELVSRDPDTRAGTQRSLEEASEQLKSVEEYRETLLANARHDIGIGNEASRPRPIRRRWRQVRDKGREWARRLK